MQNVSRSVETGAERDDESGEHAIPGGGEHEVLAADERGLRTRIAQRLEALRAGRCDDIREVVRCCSLLAAFIVNIEARARAYGLLGLASNLIELVNSGNSISTTIETAELYQAIRSHAATDPRGPSDRIIASAVWYSLIGAFDDCADAWLLACDWLQPGEPDPKRWLAGDDDEEEDDGGGSGVTTPALRRAVAAGLCILPTPGLEGGARLDGLVLRYAPEVTESEMDRLVDVILCGEVDLGGFGGR